MQEEWRDVVGYEGLYQVSNIGLVKSMQTWRGTRERILKEKRADNGYCLVEIYKSKERKTHLIHRIVAEAFIPNPDNKPEIDHIDGTRDNNKIDNLRWCTRKENHNFPIYRKRRSNVMIGRTGKSNGKSRAVVCIDTSVVYFGTREAQRMTGVNQGSISAVCRGKLKTAGGFRWQYANKEDTAGI